MRRLLFALLVLVVAATACGGETGNVFSLSEGRVEREDHRPGSGCVQDAVDHDGGRLEAPLRERAIRPGQPQAIDVAAVEFVIDAFYLFCK